MIRFTASEYLKKIWINVLIILIFAAAMISQGTMLSETGVQSLRYKSIMENMDERSFFLNTNYDDEIIKEIEKYGNVSVNKVYFAHYEKNSGDRKQVRLRACPDKIMSYVKPRLDSGKMIEKCKTDKNTAAVYISQNNLGIKAGDKITLSFTTKEGLSEDVKVLVAGILSEGQMIYGFDGAGQDFNYRKAFSSYSYNQLGNILAVTTEKEMEKINSNLSYVYESGIVYFDSDVTDEQAKECRENVVKYEKERNNGISYIESSFPDTGKFIETSRRLYTLELKKYIPMTAVITVISIICLMGIISIKTDMNMRLYTVAYLCGMRSVKMVISSGMETFFDAAVAFAVFMILSAIQERYEIAGKINLNISAYTVIPICLFIIISVAVTVIVSAVIIKKNTPVQLIRDAA